MTRLFLSFSLLVGGLTLFLHPSWLLLAPPMLFAAYQSTKLCRMI